MDFKATYKGISDIICISGQKYTICICCEFNINFVKENKIKKAIDFSFGLLYNGNRYIVDIVFYCELLIITLSNRTSILN